MKEILFCILVLSVPLASITQIPEWKSETVLVADYGDRKDEFGFEGIVKTEDTSPVSAFYVDDRNIYK